MKVTREDRRQLKRVLNNLGRRKTKRTIFYDLCFCLCAPQTTFKNNIKVIKDLKVYGAGGEGFYKTKNWALTETHIQMLCTPVRFYNNKARYLMEAKENFEEIYNVVKRTGESGYSKREWLVKNVKGLGMKAASHFLRNLGHTELAIIDTHILKFLAHDEYELEEVRKMATTRKGYESLEFDFKVEASDYRMTTAELDALVWKNYSKTSWEDFKF